ncbi:hypothetical protein [Sulfurisphaera ohwakuensis]|uniref:Putative membrane protein n=1 Tax=Sulfurisphaera ohwakuensis TaxID=69656 RepID=A0A650CG38_SULOH|nr:hypothetical protein [Sulfurisphaera ohwakuensis]MBB5254454.1 putative membrane protein [Sulfurisphaera ohwakuensis]QGR16739.1 hypothetical protein D1869_05715 [Sulfurisphaera ohwakuensis]
MDASTIGFISSFLPCSFEGFEMSMFYSLAYIKNRAKANLGAIIGIFSVLGMLYLTYLFLPILISDTGEHMLKLILGFTFFVLATYFLYREDYPEPKTAFVTAFIGIVAEGIEVNLFSISASLMTGSYMGILGGIIGFLWTLFLFKELSLRVPKRVMKYIAIGILYSVGFVVLTSGII